MKSLIDLSTLANNSEFMQNGTKFKIKGAVKLIHGTYYFYAFNQNTLWLETFVVTVVNNDLYEV